MRLHVRVVGTEQFLRTLDRQLLSDIDVLATAVIALAWITFSVLVSQDGTLCLQHTGTGVVLGSDQLDVIFLTLPFALDGLSELGIKTGDVHGLCEHDVAFVTDGEASRRLYRNTCGSLAAAGVRGDRSMGYRYAGDTLAEQGRRPSGYSRPSTTAVHACARFNRL